MKKQLAFLVLCISFMVPQMAEAGCMAICWDRDAFARTFSSSCADAERQLRNYYRCDAKSGKCCAGAVSHYYDGRRFDIGWGCGSTRSTAERSAISGCEDQHGFQCFVNHTECN